MNAPPVIPLGVQNKAISLYELYRHGYDSLSHLESLGKRIIDDLTKDYSAVFLGEVGFEMGPLKRWDRIADKVRGDYNDEFTKAADIVRGRITIRNTGQLLAIRQYINTHGQALGIETIKDRFAEPSGTHFRDMNIKLRLPNGHISEIRIEMHDIMQAAKRTHKPYQQIQTIDRQAQIEQRPLTDEEALRRQQLLDLVRDIHDSPANKSGVSVFLNEAGIKRLAQHARERVSPPDVNTTLLGDSFALSTRDDDLLAQKKVAEGLIPFGMEADDLIAFYMQSTLKHLPIVTTKDTFNKFAHPKGIDRSLSDLSQDRDATIDRTRLFGLSDGKGGVIDMVAFCQDKTRINDFLSKVMPLRDNAPDGPIKDRIVHIVNTIYLLEAMNVEETRLLNLAENERVKQRLTVHYDTEEMQDGPPPPSPL